MGKNRTLLSKSDIKEIVDGLYLQSVWICMCIDELEAIKEIGTENIKKYKVQNFVYITHDSLIYRFSMELSKLLHHQESMSIYHICNICTDNAKYFGDFDIDTHCKQLKTALKIYDNLEVNLWERRSKTYAHNDKDYYLFSQKAIDDFPLDIEDIKTAAYLIYNFSETLKKILSPEQIFHYPTPTDDVKRLFGIRTESEMYLYGGE